MVVEGGDGMEGWRDGGWSRIQMIDGFSTSSRLYPHSLYMV